MENPLLLAALLCLLLPAVHSDVASRTIPNWLTLTGCAAGLVLSVWLGGWPGLVQSLLALLLAFGITFLFWLCGWLGAGDVKLLAAVASLTGLALLPSVLVLTAFSGLVLALAVMLWQGKTRDTLLRLYHLLGLSILTRRPMTLPDTAGDVSDAARLPYAIAIATGSLLAVWQSHPGAFA